MKRRIHRSACAALALIALSLTGAVTQCQWKNLVVEIPDLEVNQIQGLQLWRADDETSQSFTEAARVVFGDCFLENGMELMQYTMLDSQNQPIGFLAPDDVEIAITIRSMVLKDGVAYVQAGAGIVADSVPERESAEVAAKAGAILSALAEAEAIYGSNRTESQR